MKIEIDTKLKEKIGEEAYSVYLLLNQQLELSKIYREDNEKVKLESGKFEYRKKLVFTKKYNAYFLEPTVIASEFGLDIKTFELFLTDLNIEEISQLWLRIKETNLIAIAYDKETPPSIKQNILQHQFKKWDDNETTKTPIIIKGYDNFHLHEKEMQIEKLKKDLEYANRKHK